MSDDAGARKRASGRQLTDRDDVDDGVAEVDTGVFQQADESVIAQRRIVKSRRATGSTQAEQPKANINWGFSATPAAATPAPEAAQAKEETPKAESPVKQSTPTKAAPTTEAPTKETTPTKEATPSKATTPSKEGTPAKESTPTKAEQTGEKAATPTNAEAPKPTFSFGTFPPAQPFGSAFPASTSTTFPSFPSFSFTQPFPSTSGASIFGQNIAPPKPKEGDDDDEGDDGESATIPEPEPTGAPTVLPQVAVVTGEEDEETLHSVRAKLFAMEGDPKAFKERGVGQLKLNRSKDGKVRLIMRDQGGKHLRLNVAVFAEMKFERASDNAIRFVAIVDKANTIFLLKVARKDEANELLSAIEEHKPKTSTVTKTTSATTPEKPASSTETTHAST